MNILDWIGATLGLIGVYLTIQQNNLCWPIAILSLIISSISFFNAKLYGDSALQLIYIVQSTYGWSLWNNNKTLADIKSYHLPKNKIVPLSLLTFVLVSGIYLLLIKFNSSLPLADAILTGLSIIATYFMIKKWIEHWLLWIVIDSAYVILYLQKELTPYALQYFVFTALAIHGYLQWRKILIK